MTQSLAIPRVIPNDWKRMDLIINKIKLRLGSAASPTFTGVTIIGLTASSLVGTNASKALESVTIGSSLTYTRPTLDAIQDIRTTASPMWVGLTLSGKVTSGSFASPVDVTVTRQYGFELHYSGNDYDVTGIRSRTRLKTTDTTATAQGALLQAANEDGIDAGVLQGALIEAIGKSDGNAATIAVMRACLVNTEWGDYDTVTNLKTLHVRTHSRNAAGAGSFGTGYGIYIENEAVGGNGQAYDAGIYFKGTNLSAGNKAFTYGIDFSGGTYGKGCINLAADPTIQANGVDVLHFNSAEEALFLGEDTKHGDIAQKSVYVGYHAGYNNDTTGSIEDYAESIGDRNVYIGQRAGAGETTLTGTLAAVQGSNAIVGTDTLFDSEVVVGDIIRIDAWINGEDYEIFEVSTITDDTHLTIDSNYLSATDSGLKAVISRGSNKGSENIGIGALSLCCNATGYENTAIGDDTLRTNTSGYGNTAIGNDALQYNTTGNYNVAIGSDNLYYNTTGNSNVGIGQRCLRVQTTANYNVAVGYQSGHSITTGGNNVFAGYKAGYKQTTSVGDVIIGYEAGYNNNGDSTLGNNIFIGYQCFYNDNGQYNIGLGYKVGFNNDTTGEGDEGDFNIYLGYSVGYGATGGTNNTGYYNVAVGYNNLHHNTTGNYNLAIGYISLYSNTSGHHNSAIGGNTLYYNTSGIQNMAVGYGSCYSNTQGNRNIAIGYGSLYFNQEGHDNTIIGSRAGGIEGEAVNDISRNTIIGSHSGSKITGCSNNTFIGYKAGYNQTTNSNLLIIDNQDRESVAAEITNSLIYGVMAATPASQSLRLNLGTFILGNPTHSDADGGGAILQQFIREQSGGEVSTAGQIEVSHDSTGDDQLGKFIVSVNTGAGLAQALEIGSDLKATFAGDITASSLTFTGDLDITGDLDVSGEFDVVGNMALGDAPVTALIGLYYLKTKNITSAGDNSVRRGIMAIQSTGKTGLADYEGWSTGIAAKASVDDVNTQDWTHATGLRGMNISVEVEDDSAGTITGTTGLRLEAHFWGGATATNYYGIIHGTPTVIDNTLVNAYAIYISDINTATTLNYAIYTGAGLVHFGDHVNTIGSYRVDSTQVVSNRGAAVANATDAATTMARLNDLLARCRVHGLIAT